MVKRIFTHPIFHKFYSDIVICSLAQNRQVYFIVGDGEAKKYGRV